MRPSPAPRSTNVAAAFFEDFDGQCERRTTEFASSGTITITETTPAVIGTFDIDIEGVSGGHLTGSFDAPRCSATSPTTTRRCAPNAPLTLP
jgi:hypothetical protein